MAQTGTERRDDTALTRFAPPQPPGGGTPASADAARGRQGAPLAWRIFFGTAAIVVSVLGATLLVSSILAERAAMASIDRALAQTQARADDLVRARAAELVAKTRIFSENVDFRSAIGAAREGDILDQAQVAVEVIGASWAQITDAEGVVMARTDQPAAPPVNLSQSTLVGGALTGQAQDGFGITYDTLLFQAAGMPIFGGQGRVLGVLMTAKYVTDSLARAIGEATNSEVIFYSLDGDGQPHLLAATPGIGGRDQFLARLRERMANEAEAGTAREEVEIGGVQFVGQRSVIAAASGAPLGGYVVLRSKDAELAAFRQLRNVLLLTGAGGLGFAFLVSLLLARQVARPVQALVQATRRAAEGDYAAEIPARGGDEIGTLADAFRRLLADLRDKQALVDFLQTSVDSARTVSLDAATVAVSSAAAGAVLAPGQRLANRYEIAGVLGVGGMGMVYKAVDRELGDVVAIKTLKPELMQQDPAALERFKSEIRLARKISHRNVVRTHDLGESAGVYYITMEFVEGTSLKELIQSRGRLPAAAVLPIAKQLCRALEVAHEAGVIHRDIKPQNMVVEPNGVLKVMDFGIARLVERAPEAGHTQAGMVVGTPEYMAPEQLMGDDLDARADIYAVGVVLYECLTGRTPHRADSPIVLVSRVLEETPVPPRDLQPDVPAALSDLVVRTLARDRDGRPRSAADLHDRIDRISL